MADPGGFTRLGDLLAGALARVASSDQGRVYGAWAQAAGDEVAAVTRPRRFARGVLTVDCESSSWAQELTYMTPMILERMRAADPGLPVAKLRFVVGRRTAAPDDE